MTAEPLFCRHNGIVIVFVMMSRLLETFIVMEIERWCEAYVRNNVIQYLANVGLLLILRSL